MVFLHLVPTMGALWLLSSVRPLQLRALQGCSIQAALAGVQVLALKPKIFKTLMVFLHLVPTMGALWLLSSVRPLQLRALQGCSIQAALAGVQVRGPETLETLKF